MQQIEVSCGVEVKWRACDQVVVGILAESVYFDIPIGLVADAWPEWVQKDTWIEVKGRATFMEPADGLRMICRLDVTEIRPADFGPWPDAYGAAECLTPATIKTRARVMGGWERRESTWSDGSPWVFHVAPIALPQGRDGLRGYLCWPDWRENPPPALEVGALVELDTLLEWIPPDAGAWNPEPRGVPICEIYAADALQPVS